MQKSISLFYLIIFTIFIAFTFQGMRGLYEPDEGRYVECAREMNISHNYLTPQINFKPHFSKPPITYWAIAACLKIFGNNEFAARLPNSIFFFLTVVIIYLIGRDLWNSNIGILSGLIYTSSIFPFIGLNFVTTDTILTFFIWLYIYFFIKKNYNFMWFVMGLAFLTKGPPSLLPFLGIFIFVILKQREELKKIFNFKNIFIFLIVGFTWYFAIIIKYSNTLSYFIKNELIGRIAGIHHRNSGIFDWIIYVPILLFGLFPWCIYWLKIKIRINKNIFMLLLFIIIPLIIFCTVRSRLPLYILPLFPGIALITSYGIISSNIHIAKRHFLKVAVILLFFKLSFVYIPINKNDKLIFKQIKPYITSENYNINLISSKNYLGLNFYFNKIIKHLRLNNIRTKLDNLKSVNYFIIFDKRKLKIFLKKLHNCKKLHFKTFYKKNVFLVKVSPYPN